MSDGSRPRPLADQVRRPRFRALSAALLLNRRAIRWRCWRKPVIRLADTRFRLQQFHRHFPGVIEAVG